MGLPPSFLLVSQFGGTGVHGLHVMFAGIRLRQPSSEEIIQVVDEMGYLVPAVEDPLNGCSQVVEDGWGGENANW